MELHLGNNIEVLKQYPDNYFDSVVTDPPYGWSMMGKKWDYQVPSVDLWKEVFRVLKHGGHILVACGTRTQNRMVCNIEDAGFEIRDVISWIYGSGFPKSLNISKAIDNHFGAEREVIGTKTTNTGMQGGNFANKSGSGEINITSSATAEATKWEGWGTALKPACEFFTLARKPLSENTVAENVLKHGTGGINIDACRVGENRPPTNNDPVKFKKWKEGDGNKRSESCVADEDVNKGRFPANLILSHHPDCEYLGTKKVKGSSCKPSDIGSGREGNFSNGIYGDKISKVTISHTDEDGMESVEEYNCHEDCPIRILDGQSGISKSSGGSGVKSFGALGNTVYGKYKNSKPAANIGGLGDIGGSSRFFYTAKSSKSERNYGLPEGETNSHPTVKPLKLMEYLIKLITPPSGICLDPFMGSGSTGISAVLNGFDFVGIEIEDPSFKTSETRINFASNEYQKGKDKPKQTELEF